jgi:plasmid stability protein
MPALLRRKAQENDMADLTVRNLDEALVRMLQVQAAEHGRSVEAAHREILRQALEGRKQPTRAEATKRLTALQEELRGRKFDSAGDLRKSRQSHMRHLTDTGAEI